MRRDGHSNNHFLFSESLLRRRVASMSDKLYELFRPRLEEEKKNDLFIYVQDGQMTPEYAAGRLNKPVA